jgi:fructokinase
MNAIHSQIGNAQTQLDKNGSLLFAGIPKPVVVGTGLVALDVVLGPQPTAAPRYWAGGTCSNVLTILAYFGWRSYPAATLGNDVAADTVIEDLRSFGVRLRFLARSSGRHTPIIVEKIRLRADGTPRHRFIWTCPSCGAWLPGYRAVVADRAAALVQRMPAHQVFFFDRVSRGALSLAHASAQRGALVVFEPNGIKAGRLFQDALQISHIIKYSHERLGPFRLLDKWEGRKLEIETLGDEGLRYRLVEGRRKSVRWKELGPYPITELKDAAGAGDWCTAGIIHALGRQGAALLDKAEVSEIEDALNLGQALAALKCRYEGPRGIMYALTKEQLEAAVEKTLDGGPLPSFAEDLNSDQLRETLKAICPSCPHAAKRKHGLGEKPVST